MSIQFQMGSGGIPAVAYPAEFVGVEPFTANAAQYGDQINAEKGGDNAN